MEGFEDFEQHQKHRRVRVEVEAGDDDYDYHDRRARELHLANETAFRQKAEGVYFVKTDGSRGSRGRPQQSGRGRQPTLLI